MTNHPDDVAGVANDGLERALERLWADVAADQPPHVALHDALGWLYQIEERLRRSIPDYYERRAGDADGRTLGGLIFARGRAAHGHTLVSRLDGLYLSENLYPGEDTVIGDCWRWAPLRIIAADMAGPDKYGRDRWYAAFEQQPVERPLIRASRFLTSLQDAAT